MIRVAEQGGTTHEALVEHSHLTVKDQGGSPALGDHAASSEDGAVWVNAALREIRRTRAPSL